MRHRWLIQPLHKRIIDSFERCLGVDFAFLPMAPLGTLWTCLGHAFLRRHAAALIKTYSVCTSRSLSSERYNVCHVPAASSESSTRRTSHLENGGHGNQEVEHQADRHSSGCIWATCYAAFPPSAHCDMRILKRKSPCSVFPGRPRLPSSSVITLITLSHSPDFQVCRSNRSMLGR